MDEELHIFSNNIEATDIPNVTLASNEDERKHSEHDTPLQNNSISFSSNPNIFL